MIDQWTPEDIRQLRHHLRDTQAEFAERMGLAREHTVSEWESGKRSPSGTARRLMSLFAELYGMSGATVRTFGSADVNPSTHGAPASGAPSDALRFTSETVRFGHVTIVVMLDDGDPIGYATINGMEVRGVIFKMGDRHVMHIQRKDARRLGLDNPGGAILTLDRDPRPEIEALRRGAIGGATTSGGAGGSAPYTGPADATDQVPPIT